MRSSACTIEEYLASMPDDRRTEFEKVRRLILESLPAGYEEQILHGMASYVIPHSLYPAGYHCDPTKPLTYISLANQKSDLAIYLMSVYMDPEVEKWFQDEWAKTGRKLKMGKCCLHFKKTDDLALDVLRAVIARVPVEKYVQRYEEIIPASKRKGGAHRTPSRTSGS